MLDKKQEIDLIVLCQKGEWDNFSPLYDFYIKPIYKFIYCKTNHQATAEDLTSTVFLKAIKGLKKFNIEKGFFSAWLYKIARNVIADHYRFRREESNLDEIWDLSGDEDQKKEYENKEKKNQLKEALLKLKPEQREIVILRIWQELSYQEIAQIVKKNENNIKMIFSRAVKKLSQEIPLSLLIILLITAQ